MSEEAVDGLAAISWDRRRARLDSDYTDDDYAKSISASEILSELIAADREYDAAMTSPANAKDLTAALRRFDAAKARRAAILSRIKD